MEIGEEIIDKNSKYYNYKESEKFIDEFIAKLKSNHFDELINDDSYVKELLSKKLTK